MVGKISGDHQNFPGSPGHHFHQPGCRASTLEIIHTHKAASLCSDNIRVECHNRYVFMIDQFVDLFPDTFTVHRHQSKSINPFLEEIVDSVKLFLFVYSHAFLQKNFHPPVPQLCRCFMDSAVDFQHERGSGQLRHDTDPAGLFPVSRLSRFLYIPHFCRSPTNFLCHFRINSPAIIESPIHSTSGYTGCLCNLLNRNCHCSTPLFFITH